MVSIVNGQSCEPDDQGSFAEWFITTHALADTWLNGNRKDVIDSLEQMSSLEASRATLGMIAFMMVEAPDDVDLVTFEIMLRKRLGQ